MPRRREATAPQTATDVLLRRINDLENQVKNIQQAKASHVQTIDVLNYNDPSQGELVIDYRGCMYYYHLNEWNELWGDCMETLKAKIVATGSGDTTIISAVADKFIRVIALDLLTSARVDIKFKSGSTDLSGVYSLPKNGGKVNPENRSGWMDCAENEAFIINLSGTAVVGGVIDYVLEDPAP